MPVELAVIETPCCVLGVNPPDEAATVELASMFKALGDPVRLRLAALIAAGGQACVCDLTPHFTVSGPTISHHLKVLREAGIVDCERRGTWVYYWILPAAMRSMSEILRVVPA